MTASRKDQNYICMNNGSVAEFYPNPEGGSVFQCFLLKISLAGINSRGQFWKIDFVLESGQFYRKIYFFDKSPLNLGLV